MNLEVQKISNLAPIALFVYNRPEHVRKVVEALRKNEQASKSNLIIFSDGPKNNKYDVRIIKVREYLRGITGFNDKKIIERENNYGLSKSIISGVSEVVSQYGKIIVLEDDLLVSPFFLQYMNDALDIYEQEPKVVSVHGYVLPVKNKLPDTFFIKGADCWGWATWKRGWDVFEKDGNKLLNKLLESGRGNEFDFNGGYPFLQMLKMQTRGLNDSWAIRWYASAFLNNLLTLYPGLSLVQNIGFDGSGKHSGRFQGFTEEFSAFFRIPVCHLPCSENSFVRGLIEDYYHDKILNKKIALMKFKNNLKLLLSNVISSLFI